MLSDMEQYTPNEVGGGGGGGVRYTGFTLSVCRYVCLYVNGTIFLYKYTKSEVKLIFIPPPNEDQGNK